MLTRVDVQNVLKALAEQEWCYWQDNFNEWVIHSLDHVGWVSLAFCAMFNASEQVGGPKEHIDTMGETYLREQMQTLIQSVSPRLYLTL